ncbi:MAG TPA: hypothetical protein P5531_06465 [Bacteroidales bacterium]|nr:hypothetical protein [Bacteroidales bacterium]HSA43720.1 hypothetical protein [Bacteroidales bacterium]
MIRNRKSAILIASLFAILLASCQKEAGSGGNSSISGAVHVTDYNVNMLVIQGTYMGADEWVYIVYGDDVSYSDRIRTGPDGRFEFKYLRKGDYTLYVYAEDTTLAGQTAVVKRVEITRNKQKVDAGTFEISKL